MKRVKYSELRIIVIDDNIYTRLTLRTMLHSLGARHIIDFPDAQTAIEHMLLNPPDIILTDLDMPGIGGIELIQAVRSGQARINPAIPIIIVSGYADRQLVLKVRDAGANEFLLKPISNSSLQQRISSVLLRPRSAVTSSAFNGPDRRRNRNTPYAGHDRRQG